MQGTVTCASMTKMPACDKVLEVGCGPGKHSVMLANTFLKQGGVLVSCDFSIKMMEALKNSFENEECDYTKVPGNKLSVDLETDYLAFLDDKSTELKNKCDL